MAANQIRDQFNDVALTLQGRVVQLPAHERKTIEQIGHDRDEQKKRLAQEQAQRRQQEIEKERNALLNGRPAPAPRPPGMARAESYQRFVFRVEKQAERNVDSRHEREIANIEAQKQKDIERQVELAEKREAERKRAAELAEAVQRAREMEERQRAARDRGR